MSLESNVKIEEQNLLKNTLKTVEYLYEAIKGQDYETANLEFEELKFALKKLIVLKLKRERRKLLSDLVEDMQRRGLNIDLAKHPSFLKNNAKNVDGKNLYSSKIHKKRQRA